MCNFMSGIFSAPACYCICHLHLLYWQKTLLQKVIQRKLRLFGHILQNGRQQKDKDPGVRNDGWFKQKRTASPRMVRWHWAVVWGNPAGVKPRCSIYAAVGSDSNNGVLSPRLSMMMMMMMYCTAWMIKLMIARWICLPPHAVYLSI